jgi:hypothetical protein
MINERGAVGDMRSGRGTKIHGEIFIHHRIDKTSPGIKPQPQIIYRMYMRKYFDSENIDLEIFMDLQFLSPLNANMIFSLLYIWMDGWMDGCAPL